MAGLILKEDFFHVIPDQSQAAYDNVRKILDNVAFTWIRPVFFVELSTKIVVNPELLIAVIPQTAVLVAPLYSAQVLSAAIAARYTGAFPWPDSVMIGFGMLGRAELCFVVLDIAFVQ